MSLIGIITPKLMTFAVDVWRLTLWLVLLAAVFVPLERLFTRGHVRPGRAALGGDLFYYFLNSMLPGVLLSLPIAALATVSQRLLPASYVALVASAPFWLLVALAVVIGEIGVYWGHRLSHEIPLLWRFHAVHHAPEHMNWLVNTRAHPVDMVFTRLCGLAPIYLLGLQSLGGHEAGSIAIITTLVGTVWAFFVHADLRWRLGPFEYLVATPGFHHWHHTNDGNINKNYAALLPMLDWVFGTMHLPGHWPPSYGIDQAQPTTVRGELLGPLRAGKAAPLRVE
jgi:sterol desaturase/sphingolipid hydroxylase (fatty acid hydroxylase superfamily)